MPAGDMDSEYSIGVRNRFIGIDSDIIEDPLELIRAAQEKPKKEKEVKGKGSKKDSKPITKGNKEKNVKIEPAQQSPPEVNKSENSDRPRGRGRGRGRGGDRGRGRGGRGGSNFTSDDSGADGSSSGPRGPRGACHRCGEEGHFVRSCPQPKSPGGQPQMDGGFGNSGGFNAPMGGGSSGFGSPNTGGFGGNDDEERRGGRGGFRGRGRGRGRGGRGGGREFDRRSGSDKSSVKAFEKRDGSGSFNWGTAQDELAASEEQQGGFGAPKETDETAVNDTEEVQETGNVSAGEDGEPKETNANQEISYEEWKKQQEGERSKPQYNIRKANEGEKVKGMKQLKKPTEEENEADGSLFFPKKYIEEKLKTSGRVKETMNLDFQYTAGDNRHMDTGRRGRNRRGGRPGRNKDESGSGFGNSKQIQLENTEEFPSL